MATNTASARRTSAILLADRKEKQGERNIFDAWIIRYNDMVKRGLTKKQWFNEYVDTDNRLTDYKWDTVDKYFGAIARAVKKYGNTDNAVKAYLLDTQKMYVEIKFFIAWAPAGQRAKGVVKKDAKQALYETVSLNRSDAVKRLLAGGVSRSEANKIATLLGIK